MTGDITLGGITFGGAPDGDGDRFVVGEIDGWELPGVSLTLVDRPIEAGAVVARARYTAQAITLAGHGISQTPAGVWRVRNKLAAACDLVTTGGTLTVEEPSGVVSIDVRLADTLRCRRAGPYAVEFEISLVAPDPVKY